MTARRTLGTFLSSGSQSRAPSAKYLGCWFAPKFYNPSGTLTYHLLTVANAGIASSAFTGASAPVAGSASWLSVGTLVRVRNNGGTIPTGLSASTAYYAGRPDSDKVSLHLTYADAVAGTNLVSFSGGTSNTDIYAAEWLDVSGQGNHLTIGSANNNLTFYGTSGYGSSASSGSSDTVAGLLSLSAGAKAALAFPSNSFLFTARILGGTPVAGRSIWGCGVSASADGPRLNVDGTDTTKLSAQWYHSGGLNINLGTTAAAAFSSAAEKHIGFAIDGPRRLAHMWVDGAPDLTVYNKSLAAAGAVTWPAGIRFGGAASNNAQASSWRDCQLLAWSGSLPGDINALVAMLATSRFYRLSDAEA